MPFPARHPWILCEITRELAAAEPRLAPALTAGRLPVRRRRVLGNAERKRPEAGTAAVLVFLLAGTAAPTGLVLDDLALACARGGDDPVHPRRHRLPVCPGLAGAAARPG
jgi:hypothetical protein